MLPISICIIAKNEENYLRTCLERLHPYQFELIIVDTGSNDNTIQLAKQYTHHVYSFAWCDDFSAARNYAISKASNDWILSIDCDEHLTNLDIDRLIQTLQTLDPHDTLASITLTSPFQLNGTTSIHKSKLVRFFSKTYFHYEGRIHEQIVPLNKTKTTKLNLTDLPCIFMHEGYRNNTIMKQKNARNINLLQNDLTEYGPDPYLYYQLGQSYFTLSEYEKAINYFNLAFEFDVNPKEQYVQTMVQSYGYSLINLKQFEIALSLEGIYNEFSTSADFVFMMGLIYMNNGLLEEAIAQFKLATTYPNCEILGVNSYSAYHNIGVIYECSGHTKEAIDYYQQAGDNPPSLERLQHLTQ